MLRKKLVNDSEHSIVAVFYVNCYIPCFRHDDACVADSVAYADDITVECRLSVGVMAYYKVASAGHGVK